ncbi:MBL fold metallo-hydrolase [Stenotrophomonas indicatrix]|uniref:MBL fold metallo-hydrolase n=1 Tax=Stenotrophomonas indicatrix TaxID=2045451 RepID=UPI001C4E31C6|nr:MBL fold metallo-hydrolase [Stenotrophomonas indicatrix]
MNSLAITDNIGTQPRLPLRVTVYKVLAGDLIHVQTPNEESLLIDCGFHRGKAILEAVLGQKRSLDVIVVTHQHLDHFATLANFVSSSEMRPRIYHSGVSYPPRLYPLRKPKYMSSLRWPGSSSLAAVLNLHTRNTSMEID